MKGRGAPDPSVYRCGPATEDVRAILSRYAAIDWFEPATVKVDAAVERFMAYHQRARAYAPDLFAETLRVRARSGSLDEFSRLFSELEARRSDWSW